MKLNRIALPFMACSLALAVTGCDEEKMEWGRPADQGDVTISEMPLQLKEQLANYDYIKAYAAQYMPNSLIGIGLGADPYINNADYKKAVDENYQIYTTGNAMKHQSVVKNDGSLNFATIDAFLDAVPQDVKLYGHNFIWHTQQQQNYLKSLIAPTMEVNSDSDIASILNNGDFEAGDNSGWGSWGNGSTATVKEGIGVDGSYGMELVNPTDASEYSAQLAYDLNDPLVVDKTYVIRFKAKSSIAAGVLQFAVQNSTDYSGEGYNSFNVGTDWTTCEYEYSCTKEGMNRVLINFGKVAATYIVDNVEFGEKVEDPMINILTGDNSDFEGGTKGSWGSWGNDSETKVSEEGEGYNGGYCAVLVNPADASEYSAQFAYDLSDPMVVGNTYMIQFYAKSTLAGSTLQFAVQNSSTYDGEGYYSFNNVGTEWVQYECEYICTKEDMNRILINFGKNAATYYVDNIKFGEKKATAAQSARPASRATTITYTFKTPEEKKEALTAAMEAWIKGMFDHMKERNENRFVAWDVLNEPISDNGGLRGIDTGAWSDGDAEPVEDPATGMSLNWADGHFYWGYYLGKEYAKKAFEFAHKYAPEGVKLFINDYNLEYSPSKLAKLIDFVNYIESDNGPKVDGIGTQMHIDINMTREQIDQMFQTLAATGKLIRVTELDVKVNTSSPTADNLASQSAVYQMVFESYKANVPEAQQSGITIWGLSDNADEHEYWIPNDAPNIFDASYARKHAYKGVCDGIAGKDISADFSGDLWTTGKETTEEGGEETTE